MSELIIIEQKKVADVFKQGGIDPYIKKVRDEVTGHVFDLETDKGRKEIASLAHKVAKSKTYLDGLGKDLVSTIKAQAKVIDSERKKMRDDLDELKEEIRRPLTEWEEKEKERINNILARCNWFTKMKDSEYECSEQLEKIIVEIESIEIDESFEEHDGFAAKNKDEALTQLKAKLIVMKDEERQAEEAKKAEAERIEKERVEREKRIAEEAAENARLEAEKKAKADRELAEAAERERLVKAELEKQRAIEAKEKAEREAKETEERLKREAELEKQRAIEEAKKREADKNHRASINNAALEAMIENGMTKVQAKTAGTLIAKRLIPNVTIQY